MNVAIVHYHFERGGVTRVVSSTIAAFADDPTYQFGLLSGRPVSDLSAPASVIPGLDYTPSSEAGPDPDDLHREVVREARKLFGGNEPDVWHIHNPALGKNTAFCGLVYRLAREGRALLLHEHDFAEDFRPRNYFLRESTREADAAPFPFSSRVHFGVINGRDGELLARAGLPEDCRVPLPNPVPAAASVSPPCPDSNLILYPVRALARKNLGEFLLLSYASGDELRWESTLPPTNPSYQSQFKAWTDLAQNLSLPARLGVSSFDDQSFENRLASARAIVTTSVAEGFGLSFLEPWTHNRPVMGRDLPEITRDFRALGISFENLYDNLPIPSTAVDLDEVSSVWLEAVQSAYRNFDTAIPQDSLKEIAEKIRASSRIDFALLSEELQMQALKNIVKRSLPITAPVPIPDPQSTQIKVNREKILSAFAPAEYASKLRTAYTRLADAAPDSLSQVDPQKILRAFLDPSRFHPHFAG